MMKREAPRADSDQSQEFNRQSSTVLSKGEVILQNIAYGTPHSRTTSEVRTAGGVLRRRRLTLPFLLVALFAMGASMFLLLPNVFAQDASTVEYPEGGTDPVATFSADDPEGDTITWSLEAGGGGVDNGLFDIDEDDGTLTFSSPPDYEAETAGDGGGDDDNDNTYEVEITATDTADPANTDTFTLNVKVTNVDEDGVVAWTVDPDGADGSALAANAPPAKPISQFQVGATLVASVTDGDIAGGTKTVDSARTDVAADPTWRWYRSPSKTSAGTMIDGETEATYNVTLADVGMYLRAVAYYLVTGNVNQESASLTSDYRVLAARVGSHELEFDPVAIDRSVDEGEEGRNVGAPVRATGNHGVVNYTLADADSGDNEKFEIDQKTGQITTKWDLDHDTDTEATAEVAGNCADENSCVITVSATDASGEAVPTNATVTITLEDVNEKPTFTDGDEAVSVAENSKEVRADSQDDGDNDSDDAANPYTATDPEGLGLTYHLMGPDGTKFTLSAGRDLSFRTAPDFENPTDRGGDNVYEVTVRASDGTLNADRMVKVTVTKVNEAPAVMGRDSVDYAENGKGAVETFTADDPEGAPSITWSLLDSGTPGDIVSADYADESHFAIDKDGVLTFAVGAEDTSPDFENPPATNVPANTYKVVVVASDAATNGQMGYHKVTVNVTDVDEDGVVTWTVDADGAGGADTPEPHQFQVGASLAASATDGDIAGETKTVVAGVGLTGNPVWEWYRGSAKIDNPATDPNTYTVTLDDVGKSLRVKVTYTVAGNVNQESASLTSGYRVLAARVGSHELEFDPVAIDRSVDEGEKGRNVGAPVRATGNHGAVNYTLADADSGDNEKFEIDQKTGQITTKWDLDHDTDTEATADVAGNCADENSCVITVRATDASGEAVPANATVTITLEDVDEKPTFTENATAMSPSAIERAEDMTALADSGSEGDVTYAATDPEGLNVNLTLMGPDGAKFQLSGTGGLSFRTAPDFENPTDQGGDNDYEVTVRASDGTLHEDRMVVVTVTNVNEAPEITITSGVVVGNTPPEFASAATTRTVAEDAAVGANVGAPVTATDADAGDTLTYTLSGTDAASFDIGSATGQLMTAVTLDFETKTSYSVTVTATDSADASDSIGVTITVTDVDEQVEMTPLERYDTNDNGRIDKDELVDAIYHYEVLETLEKADLVDLIFSYEVG